MWIYWKRLWCVKLCNFHHLSLQEYIYNVYLQHYTIRALFRGGVWCQGPFAPLARVLPIQKFFANMNTMILLYVVSPKSFKFTFRPLNEFPKWKPDNTIYVYNIYTFLIKYYKPTHICIVIMFIISQLKVWFSY